MVMMDSMVRGIGWVSWRAEARGGGEQATLVSGLFCGRMNTQKLRSVAESHRILRTPDSISPATEQATESLVIRKCHHAVLFSQPQPGKGHQSTFIPLEINELNWF